MNTENTQDREALLTSYALGELDEPSRAQVEKDFLQDQKNLAYVEQTRELANQLARDLKTEASQNPAGLREDQVAAIENALNTKSRRAKDSDKIIRFPGVSAYGLLALAACATFLVIILSVERIEPRMALMAIPSGNKDLMPLAGESKSDAADAKDKKESSKDIQVTMIPSSPKGPVTKSVPPGSTPVPMLSEEPDRVDGDEVAAADSKKDMAEDGSLVSEAPISATSQDALTVTTAPVMRAPVFAASSDKPTFYAEGKGGSGGGTGSGVGSSRGGAVRREKEKSDKEVDNDEKENIQLNGYADRSRSIPVNGPGDETYAQLVESPFVTPQEHPLSTFGLDIDTASYSNVRRFLKQSQLPPRDAVRIEEMLNYFNYDYPKPATEHPFSVSMEVIHAPWAQNHLLARIGFRALDVSAAERKKANIVFLIDVSGSMGEPDKLPLVQQCMRMLTRQLKPADRVAIVTYAGDSRVALPSTAVERRDAIIRVIDSLNANGCTNGEGGIKQAYEIAREHFIPDGINRIVLCTDGDFNVGESNPNVLGRLIAEKAKSGVELSVYGFGMGNLKDVTMEQLAMNGHGNYGYIDSSEEARNTFVRQVGGSLVTVAKDVKLQVEFNPAVVSSYRLIGYDHRKLAARDFNNDRKTSGNITAGHTVTALYEIIPVGNEGPYREPNVDALKYQANPPVVETAASGNTSELMTVKLRYKRPTEDESIRVELPVANQVVSLEQATSDTRFATAVAAFGLVLQHSSHRGSASYQMVQKLAEPVAGGDEKRQEFLELAIKARGLDSEGGYR